MFALDAMPREAGHPPKAHERAGWKCPEHPCHAPALKGNKLLSLRQAVRKCGFRTWGCY